MPAPYSSDLRKAVIRAYERGRRYDEIADEFGLGRATVTPIYKSKTK